MAGLAAALLTYGAPAAFAYRLPPRGSGAAARVPAQMHAINTGGMPGWQIIAAAAVAVVLDRARAVPRS